MEYHKMDFQTQYHLALGLTALFCLSLCMWGVAKSISKDNNQPFPGNLSHLEEKIINKNNDLNLEQRILADTNALNQLNYLGKGDMTKTFSGMYADLNTLRARSEVFKGV